MENQNAIIDLAIDLAKGSVATYSKEEANEKLREALNKLTGSADGKFDAKKFRRNKNEIFEIIEEVVDARVEEGIKDQFDQFVDYRSTAFGDKLSFTPESDELFEVAKIAGGTNNLRRQRIAEGQPYQIDTDWYGVAIYEELERFLAGRVDWVKLVNRVETSFKAKITEQIFNAVKAAYNGLTAPYKHTGSWDVDEFNTLVEHVRAQTGMNPMVIGTRLAVQKAVPAYVSEDMKNSRNADGYFKEVDGITFGIMPQAHKVGTDEFAIDNNFLLVLPNGNEKIVKFVMEGVALIDEAIGNKDDSKEYELRKKYGVGVETAAKYGVYILA
ncbi:hypothetical protein GRF59_15185 [Paenibacillus sp. HJL G12]|uniref:Phage major capsid protein n=1 Tax=Paenibacillus dendrobii TaxID=2691084 RepID=A0A7X3IJQ7_9BACL|nr:hypothetical protein [Paenibacillus dendrobii]MWV44965.1 hypothetical protein [Paenibacillus dendrobii]